jgi:hypothetical protein
LDMPSSGSIFSEVSRGLPKEQGNHGSIYSDWQSRC